MPSEKTSRTHAMDGDGLMLNFYEYMLKKNKDTNFEPCPGVMVPDTIVYEHSFPRSWLFYERHGKDLTKGVLKKKMGQELDSASIQSAFKKPTEKVNIVAYYMQKGHTGGHARDENECVTIRYLDIDALKEFLGNRQVPKGDGILQKFVCSQGDNNSLIQAVWSPRICMLHRRLNVNSIEDQRKELSMFQKAATYEGAAHLTEDGVCSPATTARVKKICDAVAAHFQVVEHGKQLSRMVLYFKIDRQDVVWLLWCGAARVLSTRPIEIQPKFYCPQAKEAAARQELTSHQEVLNGADEQQLAMSHDFIIYSSLKSHGRLGLSGGGASGLHSQGALGGGGLTSGSTAGGGASNSRYGRAMKMIRAADEFYTEARQNAPEEVLARIEALKRTWWAVDPAIAEDYTRKLDACNLLQTMLEDCKYAAYDGYLASPTQGEGRGRGWSQRQQTPCAVDDLPAHAREFLLPAYHERLRAIADRAAGLKDAAAAAAPELPPLSRLPQGTDDGDAEGLAAFARTATELAADLTAHFHTLETQLRKRAAPMLERQVIALMRDHHAHPQEDSGAGGDARPSPPLSPQDAYAVDGDSPAPREQEDLYEDDADRPSDASDRSLSYGSDEG